MPTVLLENAISAVPPGRWAVGVSGGADSVALLALLRRRGDLQLHVVHLDHETRAGESADDAAFVSQFCASHAISCTLARRNEIEPFIKNLPNNRSARFRALRFTLFQSVCKAQNLQGVILAHHAADQAETIFQRLLRGSGPIGLSGMKSRARINGLTVLRPLLPIAPAALRDFLRAQAQPWREDASNTSPAYQRNRVRALLDQHPALVETLLETCQAMSALTTWIQTTAPALGEEFAAHDLEDCPEALATQAARRWLGERGVPRTELTPDVLLRLLEMARDAATPPRQYFPGGILVGRRKGKIFVALPDA
jgi:tRNA(Ile)-lysidine synthase